MIANSFINIPLCNTMMAASNFSDALTEKPFQIKLKAMGLGKNR